MIWTTTTGHTGRTESELNNKGIEHRLDNLDSRVQQGFAQMAEGFTRMAQGFEALAAEIGKSRNAEEESPEEPREPVAAPARKRNPPQKRYAPRAKVDSITPVSGKLTEEQFREITGG